MNSLKPFSIGTIQALTEVITGGASGDSKPSIGHYRSGPNLERFFANNNLELRIGSSSRVPAVLDLLTNTNKLFPDRVASVIESVVNPSDYIDSMDRHIAVVEHLNKRLDFDGMELKQLSKTWKLVARSTGYVAIEPLEAAILALDYRAVEADLSRAIEQADTDPEGAITAACSTIESVCKCLLDDMGKPYPTKQDIKGLASEVSKHLNLSPGRTDLPEYSAADIRQVLSGLASVTSGIGALRTHTGDAHGRGKQPRSVNPRIARLAIHSASTISLFFIETWNAIKSD